MKQYQKEIPNETFNEFLPERYYYAGKITQCFQETVVILAPKEYRSTTYHWVDVISHYGNGFSANDIQFGGRFFNEDWGSEFYQFDNAKEMYTWVASQL